MKVLYLLLAILTGVTCNGQALYRRGCIVLNNGDTIKGKISFKKWNSSPKSVLIAIEEKGHLMYGYREIKAIIFPGSDKYERVIYARDTLILHLLADGQEFRLLGYRSDDQERYFLQKSEDRQLVELIGIEPQLIADTLTPVKVYWKQLGQALQGSKSDNAMVRNFVCHVPFFEDWLVRAVNYMNSGSASYILNNAIQRTSKNIFIGTGYAINTIAVKGRNNEFWDLKFSPSKGAYFHVGMDFANYWNLPDWQFRVLVTFMPPLDIIGYSSVNPLSYQYQKLHLNQTIYGIGPTICRFLSIPKLLRCYLGAEAKMNFGQYRENMVQVRPLSGPDENKLSDFKLSMRWFSVGLSGGVYPFHNFQYELHFSAVFGDSFASNENVFLSRNIYGIGLFYHFLRL